MKDYVIMTDSSCDLPAALAEELELLVIPLTVLMEGKQYTNYLDWREIAPHEFYGALRKGKSAITSAINIEQFKSAMEPALQEGKDVLYLGFSSGLSGTYGAGTVAAAELNEQYPQTRVLTCDTLCASLGQGLLVYLAAQEKKKGRTIDEVKAFVEENKLRLCHWFTVDDLNHLKRGGRVSAATALVGTMLSIKPVLHVDDEGHLINMAKARGRKVSILALVEHMQQSAVEPAEQTVFISHGDCVDEAKYLADLVSTSLHVKKPILINHVGPVIGAHSGPGTLALFFVGNKR